MLARVSERAARMGHTSCIVAGVSEVVLRVFAVAVILALSAVQGRVGVIALASLLVLGGCKRDAEAPPVPFAMTQEAMGRYCGSNILEYAGPKGQIILARYVEPVWFSSARDAIAFTMLPEEPKDIRAFYVSDMAKAASWDDPGADNWVDAKDAFFVIGSRRKGGMGAREAVPFSSEHAARFFAAEHGGTVFRLRDIPRDYIMEQ